MKFRGGVPNVKYGGLALVHCLYNKAMNTCSTYSMILDNTLNLRLLSFHQLFWQLTHDLLQGCQDQSQSITKILKELKFPTQHPKRQ